MDSESVLDMETRIGLEQARERLEIDVKQASLLEKRHRENEKAINLLDPKNSFSSASQVKMCLGREAFISLPYSKARSALVLENERLWDEIDNLQRRITKEARQLEELEECIQAALSTVPSNK